MDQYSGGNLPISQRVAQRNSRRKKNNNKFILRIIVLLLILAAIITGIVWGVQALIGLFANMGSGDSTPASAKPDIPALIYQADRLAYGYDYDAAIELIKSYGEDYESKTELVEAIGRYEATKATMVRHADVYDIPHVFFHTLIVDTSKSFDGEYTDAGYNQYMTTVSEFNKMLEEMYKRDFVLVDIHDVAYKKTMEDGTTKFVAGDIMLPPGKQPFVMSQDDVSYYSYMSGDGFATKIVIGEDGMPTCEYVQDDGTVVYGDYDLVPLLETFIQAHPDFSYRGARATLALTGYDGVLGYRTCPTADDYSEADVEQAKIVAQRMRECGWTFASHSWGHRLYGSIGASTLEEDSRKWDTQVKPIVGETDVIIYAHGEDIAGIENYSGPKYEILKSFGFDYFCNVDAHDSWLQINKNYVRQGRRNLDGYRMWYNPEMLDDLFDVDDVWDNTRPTPVPPI